MTDDLRAFTNNLFATAETARVELKPETDPDTTMREFTRSMFASNKETS